MSPLGSIVPRNRNFAALSDSLLKLMSVSVVPEVGLQRALNLNLARSGFVGQGGAMQVKSLPAGSPIQVPSPDGSLGELPGRDNDSLNGSTGQSQRETDTPLCSDNGHDDDDEVLSIGREDEDRMLIDCDDSSVSDEKESVENETEEPSDLSQSPPLGEKSRIRNYSTESTASSTPNGFLSLPSARSLSQQASREALIFSIANILRPDFGLNNEKSSSETSDFLFKEKSPRHGRFPQPLSSLAKLSRSDPTIPIDLSRPASTGSSGGSGHSPNHHRIHSHKSHEFGIRKNSHHTETKPPAAVNNKASRNTSLSPTPSNGTSAGGKLESPWPAWVYCTRYSDRPSSGPRTRRGRKKEKEIDEKRPRTAFTADQLSRLKKEFDENRYLTEKRRQDLARDLRLHENQIKIWFQNKRAKLKKSTGQRGGLALQLMAQGLYNHSTIPSNKGEGDDSDE